MKTRTTYLVYKLEICGFVYIGKTNNFERRIWDHKYHTELKNSCLYKTIRELGGWDLVKVSVIDDNIPLDQIKDLEKHYIKLFRSYKGDNPLGLNSNRGGGGVEIQSEEHIAKRCKPKSEETKLKMSISKKGHKYNLGRIQSEETKRKISAANKGHKYNLGKIQSEETRLKKAESMKQYHQRKKGLIN